MAYSYFDLRKERERHAIYVQRIIELLSCNHCCRSIAMRITQYKSVFTALGTQQARVMRHIVACPAVQYFTHISSKMARFFGKKLMNIRYEF